MGTRCGDIDAGVVIELVKRRKDAKSVEEELNKKSGLLALCGTADMREIEERANSGTNTP